MLDKLTITLISIEILCAIGILRCGWIILVKNPLTELGLYPPWK